MAKRAEPRGITQGETGAEWNGGLKDLYSGSSNRGVRLDNARLLPLDAIEPDPDQPRKFFPAARIRSLARSILRRGLTQTDLYNGLLHPIVVRTTEEGVQKLVAGERRLRAFRYLAGLDSLEDEGQPAGVALYEADGEEDFEGTTDEEGDILDSDFDRTAFLEIPATISEGQGGLEVEIDRLVENDQRDDLSNYEWNLAYDRLRRVYSLSATQIAKRVGKDKSTVGRHFLITDYDQDGDLTAMLLEGRHINEVAALARERKRGAGIVETRGRRPQAALPSSQPIAYPSDEAAEGYDEPEGDFNLSYEAGGEAATAGGATAPRTSPRTADQDRSPRPASNGGVAQSTATPASPSASDSWLVAGQHLAPQQLERSLLAYAQCFSEQGQITAQETDTRELRSIDQAVRQLTEAWETVAEAAGLRD